VWVPSLILQPLIENAVVHGMSGHQGIVTVSVSVSMANETLLLRVTNSVCVERTVGEDGIGLKNVRERMAVQFEGRASLIAGVQGSEWISEISMPAIRESPPLMREAAAGNKLHTTTLVGT
jgi:LytS/YehU family sensor histidine kinase